MKVTTNLHHIRKEILRTLTHNKWARFRDMKPTGVDSNLYNYHLKQLISDGFVERHEEKGYRLSPMGLRYVDHISLEKFEPRWQPKIMTKLYVTDEHGRILMWPKYKQPFIGTWSLPSGKMHYDDPTVSDAMKREISYFLTSTPGNITYRGVIEINASISGELVTHAIEHVFRASTRASEASHEYAQWIDVRDVKSLKCSPGTIQVIEAMRTYTSFFHESYDIEW